MGIKIEILPYSADCILVQLFSSYGTKSIKESFHLKDIKALPYLISNSHCTHTFGANHRLMVSILSFFSIWCQ
jgi:hypothetical protein